MIRMSTPTIGIVRSEVCLLFATRDEADMAYNLLWRAIDEDPCPARAEPAPAEPAKEK